MSYHFNPEIELDHRERAALAIMVSEEGFEVLKKIIRSEVDQFIVDLLNEDPTNPKAILEKHRISKTAAQLYEAWIRRVNSEVQNYTAEMSVPMRPVDPTDGALDFGPHVRGSLETSPLEGGIDDTY